MTGWSDPDAVVVGAGPNGLAAALTLAREGFRVVVFEAAQEPGGGTRSYPDPDVAGLIHDHCSAVHPLGVASPLMRSLPLERYGLRWRWAPVDLAHPLDDGTAAVLQRDLASTVTGLGADGPMWQQLVGPFVDRFDEVSRDLLGPLVRLPRHPVATARAGLPGVLPATTIAKRFPTEAGAALFAGLAAHAVAPLDQPMTAAVALMLASAGHVSGWPVAEGGSQSIWRSMVAYLEDLGGEVVTSTRIRDFADLPRTRVALFDTSPTQLNHILGGRLDDRPRRQNEAWTYGPGAFKVDLAIEGEVPWTAVAARQATTVHLGGTAGQIAAAEAQVAAGEVPDRPFTLVAQPHVADPRRQVGGITPLWAYIHVPHGSQVDAADQIEAQIERFAPGFTARVRARHVTGPVEFEQHNPNLHGGDIAGGANTPGQLIGRPRLSGDPYRAGVPGVYLCSASTPPGGGVHGMCGYHAARSALRVLTA